MDIAGPRYPIYVDSDNLVMIGPIFDLPGTITTTQLRAATGLVTLYDQQGAVIGAIDLPTTLVADSDPCRFYAIVTSSVTIVEGRSYYTIATMLAGGVTLVLKEQLVGVYSRRRGAHAGV